MAIDALLDLINIRGLPTETPSAEEWSSFENRGLNLPKDFKAFLSTFGTGVLADFFYVWNPFSNVAGMNWHEEKERTIRSLRVLIAKFPDDYGEWKFYPEAGGLIPFGKTGNGDILFWLAGGAPDQWRIAISNGEPSLAKSSDTLSTFLANALTQPQYCAQLPNLSSAPKTFLPLVPTSR
jgi:hypothetical protein